ncbi:hypothetical protein [Candidatus Albibeggiatoa sp. nov. BB20]
MNKKSWMAWIIITSNMMSISISSYMKFAECHAGLGVVKIK